MRKLRELSFDNRYARLPPTFAARLGVSPLHKARLGSFNTSAAALLDLHPDEAASDDMVKLLNGQTEWPGTEPLASVYAGHQFGQYVPQLGDGRAILLGEVVNKHGHRWEIQLKGGGPTPFSRMGDGRAVLRSTIREYLCSEAMHSLGIPSTRALCILASDHPVRRETLEPGALLVRLAPTHVRFGTFEYFYHRGMHPELRTLADFVIEHHYPQFADQPNKYAVWLTEIVARTARLMAQWQSVGFAHGVMNTDNMSILGITLDYGPFGFLDQYDAGFICNHSDHSGRYAFDQQPNIGLWNSVCLAEALTPLMPIDDAKAALETYQPVYAHHYFNLMREKFGMKESNREASEILNEALALLQANQVDYTRFMRALGNFKTDNTVNSTLRDMFLNRESFDTWAVKYQAILRAEGSNDEQRKAEMNRVNPKYILRNYLAENAIKKAQNDADFGEVNTLLALLQRPFDEQPEHETYADEPPDWARKIEVSCSS